MTLDVSKPILRTGPAGNRPADGTGVSGSNGGSGGGFEAGREIRDFVRDGTFVVDGSGRIGGAGSTRTASGSGRW